jgi:SNF2-related domain
MKTYRFKKMIQLRDYQKQIAEQGADIVRKYGMTYLALQVRVGKTLTALTICDLLNVKRVLFLTKKKAIASIEKDMLSAGYFFFLMVTNYENIHNVENITQYDLFVIDEAHVLAQYPKMSQRTKRLKQICHSKPIIYLSGTPAKEGYSEIFHQLNISDNSIYNQYKNFYDWAREYVKVKQVKRGAYLINDYSNADGNRIKNDLKKILISHSQEEAGFNCPVKEQFLLVSDPIIPQMMKKILKDKLLDFSEGKAIADTPAATLNKIHQIAGGSIICENGTAIISEKKAEFIKNYFKDKRIVIFYKYIGEKTILDKWFPSSTNCPEEFQAGKSDTFIGQVISCREGIDLSTADCIVMYSIDFAALSYLQSMARIQNMNRQKESNVYWIFFENSIERRVYAAVSQKLDYTYSFFKRSGEV